MPRRSRQHAPLRNSRGTVFARRLDGTIDDAEDDTLYYCNDANMNVTALVDGSDGDIGDTQPISGPSSILLVN